MWAHLREKAARNDGAPSEAEAVKPRAEAPTGGSGQNLGVEEEDFFARVVRQQTTQQASPLPTGTPQGVSSIGEAHVEPLETRSGEGEREEEEEEEEAWDETPNPVSLTHTPQKGVPPLPEKGGARVPRQRSAIPEDVKQKIMKELREYMLDFADPDATDDLNDILDQRSYSDLYRYYTDRPELAQYTLDSEFERLSYEVLFHGQQHTCETPEGRRRVREVLEEVLDQGGEDLATGYVRPAHLLLRMANQSLVADTIGALTNYLLKPELETSVMVDRLSFLLDLDAKHLFACVVVRVATITAAAPGQLELGKVACDIVVDAAEHKALFRFKRPGLNVVLDRDLELAAAAIAEHRVAEDGMRMMLMMQEDEAESRSQPHYGAGAESTQQHTSSSGEGSGLERPKLLSRNSGEVVDKLLVGIVATIGGMVGVERTDSTHDEPVKLYDRGHGGHGAGDGDDSTSKSREDSGLG